MQDRRRPLDRHLLQLRLLRRLLLDVGGVVPVSLGGVVLLHVERHGRVALSSVAQRRRLRLGRLVSNHLGPSP